ncbi:DUF1330 domain-containing protein (plasmid) [Paroceanicella profunda]|uniref:DUF1330 domain-containing protein n=1 Tax=Paroceanicella profunda TaxID=2579971 RepID=A0A5B8G2T5_9RHOB|nr:DUF1330 domain-containing protein [Paroceanicella profunda]QDL94230.1 DUF1330 domain-containing protein [Paroceanicella profunda]
MPAYVVFTREETLDQAELDTYSANVGPTLEGHEVTPRVAYGEFEVLEGPDIEGAVILEFPDMQAARTWYFSPAYQDVVQHRFKGARYRGFIVQGR